MKLHNNVANNNTIDGDDGQSVNSEEQWLKRQFIYFGKNGFAIYCD